MTHHGVSDHLILTIARLAWRGRGVAVQEDGPTVLVDPGALPGETVRVQVVRRKKDYWEARLLEVLEPSPLRRPHPCPHAGECGGSPFGIMAPHLALELKEKMLVETLDRVWGHGRSPAPTVVPSPSAWHYRYRAQIHVAQGKPHFRSGQSHRMVPLTCCYLLAAPLGAALEDMARRLPPGRHTVAASPVDGRYGTDHDGAQIRLQLPGCSQVDVPAGVFFQANQLLNPRLVEEVLEALAPWEAVIDLFAGMGNFALPLAARGHRVLALEGSPRAVEAGRHNARALGLDGVRFQTMDVYRQDLAPVVNAASFQAVVVDPPRTGARHVAHVLAACPSIQRIVWVSCDVPTAMRDVGALPQLGFILRSATLLDMFPGTWHMEVLLVWDRERT